MTVDGANVHFPQKGITKKGNTVTSHKYTGKSALRYKLGVDILAGNLYGSRVHTLPERIPTLKILKWF
jgi:hypothetical protein